MYAHVPYYTKVKSKRKFKIRNIKLSKISPYGKCLYGLHACIQSMHACIQSMHAYMQLLLILFRAPNKRIS